MMTPTDALFRRWSEFAATLGFTDFLRAEDSFRTHLASGRPWTNPPECGVYLWITDDGETYVGETVQAIRTRLMAHRRKHPDIRFACFQPCPVDKLKVRERELIDQTKAAGFSTRNIKGAMDTRAYVPFDKFITPAEREAFITSDVIDNDHDDWQDLPLTEQKQAPRFRKFMALPDRDLILESFGLFLWSVMPRPRRLENRFWSVTLGTGFLRVNAGHQEIFTVTKDEEGLWARIFSLYPPDANSRGPLYKSKSYCTEIPLEQLVLWLENKELLISMRTLAIQLMRHTTALNNDSHCPQIVRAAWAHLMPAS